MTLIEVVIACTITAVIIGGLSVAIYTIVNITERGNAESAALHDLQQASYWIGNDTQMAWTTSLSDGGSATNNVTLRWTNGDGSSHYSIYQLAGTRLQRNYDGNITTVAQYISSLGFSISGRVFTFGIVSNPPGRQQISRQSTGEVYLRAKT